MRDGSGSRMRVGRPSWQRVSGKPQRGPTLAAEYLADKHGIQTTGMGSATLSLLTGWEQAVWLTYLNLIGLFRAC